MQDEGVQHIFEDVAKNPTDEIAERQAGKPFLPAATRPSIFGSLVTIEFRISKQKTE